MSPGGIFASNSARGRSSAAGELVAPALVTAAAVAGAIVGPGALAHLAAGGSLAMGPTLASWIALTLVAAAIESRVRWTFPRLALAALLAQPVLHRVFAASHGAHSAGGHHHGAHAGGHLDHDHASMADAIVAPAGASDHGSAWMAVAHVVVAFAVAAILRWGVRWLRSMPALARAFVMAGRGAVTPIARPMLFVAAPPAMRPARLAIATCCGTRGPPR